MEIERRRQLCLVSHGCRRHDGQSRVNYEIVKAAIDRGWQVTFIGSHLSEELRDTPALRWLRVPESPLPSNLIKNLIFAVRATALLRKHKPEFDIVHTNGFIVWAASDINTVHFVHSGWLQNPCYPYKPVRSPYALYQTIFTHLNSYLERHAFNASPVLIAVSAKVREEIKSAGIGQEKLTVIHNGVDLDEFHPGPGQRARFFLDEGPTLFLFAGDIRSKRKNLESVIKALALVPKIHLAVAGALQGSPYPDLARMLGVANRVHFLGLVTEMPLLMRSVDGFVFPSRYEACSLVLFEALASGLPVITAASAGGAEVIGDGGVVMENPDDIEKLAESMTLLADDSQLRSTMARRARQIAETLSWSHMTGRYLEIYQRAL